MFVPGRVAAAAGRGDLARVQSWLNNAGPGAVNYACVDGYTCLLHSVSYNIRREDVELARFLISHGADVNLCSSEGWAPLHFACSYPVGPDSVAMISLLLQAGARVNARTCSEVHAWASLNVIRDTTPLGLLLQNYDTALGMSNFVGSMVALLRAGASLDRITSTGRPAEEVMGDHHGDVDEEDYIKCQTLIAGVREHGSYKRYLRAPHREFLRFRSLLVRGRAVTRDLCLERIARLPDGACWKVLSYWREDN